MAVFSKPLPHIFTQHPPSKRTVLLVIGTVLLLRALPGRILRDVLIRALNNPRGDKGKEKGFPDDQLKQTLQQIYEEDEQGRLWLLVPYEGGVRKVSPRLQFQAAAARSPTSQLSWAGVVIALSPSRLSTQVGM